MAGRRLGFWRRFAVMLVLPSLSILTRPTWWHQDKIPQRGGVILVANHVSEFDPLLLAKFVYKSGRWPRFLAKASLWRVPVLGPLLRRTQQIPVERGSVEAVRSLDTLVAALRQGGAVIIYPEGTTTRDPELWPMRGKTGAARLALATGAPVVPVASWGAQALFDTRTKKFRPRLRTPVRVTAGDPIDLSKWLGQPPSRAVLDEMTEALMLTIRDLLGTIRDGTPPPLFERPARRTDASPAVPE